MKKNLSTKVAVIGCTHAGTAFVNDALRIHPNLDIKIFEKNDSLSFLSCGIALSIGGIVKDPKSLFYSSPDALKKMGAHPYMEHAIVDFNGAKKELKIKNLKDGSVSTETFDKILISTGSWPVIPKLKGIEEEKVVLCKNYYHALNIIEKAKSTKSVVVVGAGYIGIELVEAFAEQGKKVTLVDMMDRVLCRYLDKEITDIVEDTLKKKGVTLALGETVKGFEDKGAKCVTNKGEYEGDLSVLCIGFRPNTDIFKGQINMLNNGAIVVDDYMETNIKGVFAAGDCCAVKFNPSGKNEYIPLATNAIRMGSLAAKNLFAPNIRNPGTQGTSGLKLYGLNISSTGMTEETAKMSNIPVKSVVHKDNYRPDFMPTNEEITLKMVYHKENKKLLGAQVVSKVDLTQSMNALSICIANGMTMQQIAYQDFFFQPHYNKPWNFLNSAAMMAEEIK